MYELRVTVKGETAEAGALELVRCLLINAGIAGERIVERRQAGRVVLSVYANARSRIASLRKRLRSKLAGRAALRLVELDDEDWKNRWKKYVRPFRLTSASRFTVVPVWRSRGVYRRDDALIYIDTTLTFGTGLHPTTRMTARFIEESAGSLGDFLDIGTGSGILSIVAARCGAQSVRAVDLDRQAVRTARRNFAINRCRPAQVAAKDIASYRPQRRFDFIAANLLTEELIVAKERLIALLAPGGTLVVSGIYADNYRLFRERFSSPRLRCARVREERDWYALSFKACF